MDAIDFYKEQKWCEKCETYVRFLMSVDHSFCVHCGTRVRLFSKEDLKAFQEAANEKKNFAGGRKRSRRSRAS